MKNESLIDTEFKISEEAVKKSSTNIIPKNNVVIATRVGLGKVCFLENDVAINQDLRAIIPKDLAVLDVYYLFWWLKSISKKIEMEGTGATVKGVKLPFVKNLDIPFPESLSEQQRIVSILDEAFAEIDKAKKNAEQNLKNAREIFESYLQSAFGNPNEHWEEKELGKIASIEYGYTEKAQDKGCYRYIRITDINSDGNLESENKMFVDYSKEAEKFILKDGDLLMARTGATFAKVLLYRDIEKSIFASYLIRINFTENIVNKLYGTDSKV